jgi:signal transduction histidine kinase
VANILVVDDSELICQVTKEYLEPLGHQISIAKTAKAALTSVEKEKPELVILDIQLPDDTGFHVCEKLREQGNSFPILLSSASNAFGPWVDQMAQGFLFNPYTETIIRAKVKALLEAPEKPVVLEPNDRLWNSSRTFVHHLRNSVGCIAGLLEMYKSRREDRTFQEQFFRLTQQAVESSTALLEEFSELNHPLELKCETVQLESLLKSIVKKHPISQSKTISISWQLDTGSLVPASADQAYLSKAINAILDNAQDAMPNGGTLTIGAYADAKRKWDYMSFQDNGVGMNEHSVQQAFVPFFTTKSNEHGTGLSWAQKILGVHGGSAELTSVPKQGTMVLMKIPAGNAR